jgi:hypothetical protein
VQAGRHEADVDNETKWPENSPRMRRGEFTEGAGRRKADFGFAGGELYPVNREPLEIPARLDERSKFEAQYFPDF